MDDADRARRLQAAEIKAATAYRRPVHQIRANGECHACYETVRPGQLFCDGRCADEFERRQQNG